MAALSGGDKLTAYLQSIDRRLASAGNQPEVRVGFLEGVTYPDGTSLPMVAAGNEFGWGNSPPRPYFRNMIKKDGPGWSKAISVILKHNEFDVAKSLTQMGFLIKGQLQQSIVDTNDPPNAPSTIRRKGAAKPLVDTGYMLRSVDFEISSTPTNSSPASAPSMTRKTGSFGGIVHAYGGSVGSRGSRSFAA